jgi:hypothetical protein
MEGLVADIKGEENRNLVRRRVAGYLAQKQHPFIQKESRLFAVSSQDGSRDSLSTITGFRRWRPVVTLTSLCSAFFRPKKSRSGSSG